jgi:hypothetical protein
VATLRTHFSNSAISVSSSQGFTSKRILLLAMRAGSEINNKKLMLKKNEVAIKNRQYRDTKQQTE